MQVRTYVLWIACLAIFGGGGRVVVVRRDSECHTFLLQHTLMSTSSIHGVDAMDAGRRQRARSKLDKINLVCLLLGPTRCLLMRLNRL